MVNHLAAWRLISQDSTTTPPEIPDLRLARVLIPLCLWIAWDRQDAYTVWKITEMFPFYYEVCAHDESTSKGIVRNRSIGRLNWSNEWSRQYEKRWKVKSGCHKFPLLFLVSGSSLFSLVSESVLYIRSLTSAKIVQVILYILYLYLSRLACFPWEQLFRRF
jgi:hypothetical protein